ncbi:23S rRNA (guanosine(2251)-2'-O)-methyltransferase RlmB [Ureaplasma miroungigenitalium]|uniref:23S rRNA (Guanosine(2251)-2'-O)-methyltransferase RlmB n=1 Tax=Ureaplasma miroungigenitalium TaxID=1042321 RepID=A0ABT3BMN4_9BACT|nr:23S rRNA (guanosine(2251)-2'-O)-methyltransferase RlmB [Ureaplasma miroungigenitalium]MCV3728488.1 23S rRNA (guanosine(2251)-2'-O)-methyltransferase RlmB [Ureaplasma miroungigenitalium]MCV3734275.1 23S rRNA (guanosine(2251)-2'-O)-methyltransferase RlmB [Ureaplasma miroungigenitalium]
MLNFNKKALYDAINAKVSIRKVYMGSYDQKIIDVLTTNNIAYEIVNRGWFNRFGKQLNHQFLAFETEQVIKNISLNEFLASHKDSKSLILMLDEVQDPHNFGAILRSADCFGAQAVIYKKNNQASINELVIKTSMGAVNYLNLICVANLSQSIKLLQENGYWVYASALNEQAQAYNQVDYANKSVIIVGNENKGISPLVIKNADQQVYIPMNGHVQSLNVSVATGVLLAYISQYLNK